MQLTLSLNRRTHLFIKDGKLFFKLYKPSKFSDKKDIEVLSDVTIEDAKRIHQWLGDVIAECKQPPTAEGIAAAAKIRSELITKAEWGILTDIDIAKARGENVTDTTVITDDANVGQKRI